MKIEPVNQARLTSLKNPSLMLMDKINELVDAVNLLEASQDEAKMEYPCCNTSKKTGIPCPIHGQEDKGEKTYTMAQIISMCQTAEIMGGLKHINEVLNSVCNGSGVKGAKPDIDNWRKNAVNPKARTGKLESISKPKPSGVKEKEKPVYCNCGIDKCNGKHPKPKYGASIITEEIRKEIDKDNLHMNNELDKKLPKPKTLEDMLINYKSHCEAMSGKKGLFACQGCREEFIDFIRSFIKENAPKQVYEKLLDKNMHPQMAYGEGWRDYRKELFEAMGIRE